MDANVELAIGAVQDENGILFVVCGAVVADAHEEWALVEFLDENVIGAGTIGQRIQAKSWRHAFGLSSPSCHFFALTRAASSGPFFVPLILSGNTY